MSQYQDQDQDRGFVPKTKTETKTGPNFSIPRPRPRPPKIGLDRSRDQDRPVSLTSLVIINEPNFSGDFLKQKPFLINRSNNFQSSQSKKRSLFVHNNFCFLMCPKENLWNFSHLNAISQWQFGNFIAKFGKLAVKLAPLSYFRNYLYITINCPFSWYLFSFHQFSFENFHVKFWENEINNKNLINHSRNRNN